MEPKLPTPRQMFKRRIISILRDKAREYEKGEVAHPSLHEIANELEAFFAGLDNE